MAITTKKARLIAEARALRALGLTAPEVGQIIERHPTWVYRHAKGVEFNPDIKLPTPRARAVARAIQRSREGRYTLGVDRVERRVARILALSGRDGAPRAQEATCAQDEGL